MRQAASYYAHCPFSSGFGLASAVFLPLDFKPSSNSDSGSASVLHGSKIIRLDLESCRNRSWRS